MDTRQGHANQPDEALIVDEPADVRYGASSPAVVPPREQRDPLANVTSRPAGRDRVRWGPVWAGLLVTLSTFAVLELALFALGWLDLDGRPGNTTAGWMSGLIGLVAFFLGGVAAGATALRRETSDGVVHGMLVWALTTVGILFLTLFGGGALFGALADVFTQLASLRTANLPDLEATQAIDGARSAAAWALLGLGLSAAAAAIGGAVGAKTWPPKDEATVDARPTETS